MDVTRFEHIHILVVDDDPGQRSLFSSFLRSQKFTVTTVSSGEEAIQSLRETLPDMIISDVRMPGMSGLDTLNQIRHQYKTLPVLLVTAYADIRDAVTAMRDGAVDYLSKPIDLDELLECVLKAVGIEQTEKTGVDVHYQLPDWVVAKSPQIRHAYQEASLVADSDSRILITGESGVGKEIMADLIHAWSGRVGQPFLKVNCAAIPENLLESELFGHEKGSFTGATNLRIGHFEEAHGGTLLLDEIAEMSPSLQAKLLRVTQDGTFQRVGSNKVRKTNTRILAATNRNLEKEVDEGRFREDLFFRLNVMEIYIPPLRERREDIIPLADYFVQKFSNDNPRLSVSVVRCLEDYDWPGNVRELANAMERAVLMARGSVIIPEHLPKRVIANTQGDAERAGDGFHRQKLEDIERDAILQSLRKNNNNRTETAKELGISRRALTYKIQRFIQQGYLDKE